VVACSSADYRSLHASQQPQEEEEGGGGGGGDTPDKDKDTSCPGEVWVPADRQIFMCMECLQPYWWSENAVSSPARAMQLAYRLHRLVQRSLMTDEAEEEEDEEEGGAGGQGREEQGEGEGDEFFLKTVETRGEGDRELRSVELKRLFDKRDAALLSFARQKQQDQFLAQAQSAPVAVLPPPPPGPADGSAVLQLSSVMSQQLGAEPVCTNWTDSFQG
jgi:hypothetical protein